MKGPRIRMRCRSLLQVALVIALGMSGSLCLPLHSQRVEILPRITEPVDESRLTPLRGNVTAAARPEFDQGNASPGTQLTSMRILLTRSAAQEAALEQFMAAQLDPSSSDYRHWLTPSEFGKLYGPSDSDIAAVVDWLQSHGLKVDSVAPGRTDIQFSGSVAQVEEAFHTSIHSFQMNGEQFYSNTTDPQIPSALSAVVGGVGHLNTLRPRQHAVSAGPGRFDFASNRFMPAEADSLRPTPALVPNSGNRLYIVPGDAATIYDTPNSFNAAFSSGTSYTGQGVTIGIGGDAAILPSTVMNYRSRFLGNATAPVITNVNNSAVANGATDEAYLDTEIAGGLAPDATIHFYTSYYLNDAIAQMLSDNSVDIFSLSFGECEYFLDNADNQLLNGWWQQAAAQGIAVTVSVGDGGSAGCDDFNSETAAKYGLQVSGFASTPYNIAVGGTDFYGLLSGFSSYVNSSNGTYYRTAKSYIPESTWNNSSSTVSTINGAIPRTSGTQTNIVGGGGGASSCSTNTTSYSGNSIILGSCTGGYAKPAWQRGTGVPSDGVRDIPDVSLMAGAGADSAAWLVCTDDTFTSSGVTSAANCATMTGGGFAFYGFGGTSASTPAVAGILALVQQKTGSRLGLAAKELYDLFNGAHASAIFHEATGNNSVVCTPGTPNCSPNSGGFSFLTGYDTNTGYDLATGLGSVDVTQLITYWGTGSGNATATLTLTPSATTITTAQSLTLSITLAGSGTLGTPTGSVSLSGGGYSSSTVAVSNAGAASFTIPAGALNAGNDTLTVLYSGDSVYASQTGTVAVMVNQLNASMTATASSSAVTSNQSFTVAVTVTGSGPTPTGKVSVGNLNVIQTLVNGAATLTIPANQLTPGSNTLGVTYSGDSVYLAKTTNVIVNVVGANVTITVGSSNIKVTDSPTFTVSVAASGSSPSPTGTVTLSGGGYGPASATLSSVGSATFTVPPATLVRGTDFLLAVYNGDQNYANSSGTLSVPVAGVAPTETVMPSSASIQSNQALTLTVALGGAGKTATGSVTVSEAGKNAQTQSLSNGSASFTYAGNTFGAGAHTLTAAYVGDTYYNPSSGNTTISVSQYTPLIPTVTVTPSSTSIANGQPLTLSISVSGSGATPAGTVTVSGGGYSGTSQALSAGALSVTIPGNSLNAGTDTLTVLYSGDLNYSGASGSAVVTVTQSDYTVSATAPAAIAKGGTATSTVSIASKTSYFGTIALTCSLTSPTGVTDAPTCTMANSPITLTSGTPSGTATVTVSTTAASASIVRPRLSGWAGGGALLALTVFFGIPARRRSWRALLGMIAVVLALGAVSACGSSGGSGGGAAGNPGTPAGQYTFTVSSTGTPSVTPAPSTTFSVTVN